MSNSPLFGGGDELFRQMLGDLLKLMPGAGSQQWLLAEQMATEIAGGEGDSNPDPLARIELEQLSAIAALHVNEIGGLPPPPGGAPRLVPVSRREWARRTLSTWRPVLDRLSEALGPDAPPGGPTSRPGAGPGGPTSRPDAGPGVGPGAGTTGAETSGSPPRPGSPPSPFPPDFDLSGLDLSDLDLSGLAGDEGAPSGAEDMSSMLGKWATAMFPMMTAMQVGSVAGHLAESALGTYDVPLAPVPDSELYVPSRNLEAIAADWSLPLSDLRLWLCAHELAYHTVLFRPAVAGRLASLVVEHAERVRPDPGALGQLLSGADPSDPEALARIFGDPAAFGGLEASPELSRVRSELDALTAAIAGYAEHITAIAAGRLIGTHAPIGEAMRRRRVGRGEGEKVAERLFGLSLDQAQIDRGERFVQGVLDRGGDVELAQMWLDAGRLPTSPEIEAPGLWLARVNLPAD